MQPHEYNETKIPKKGILKKHTPFQTGLLANLGNTQNNNFSSNNNVPPCAQGKLNRVKCGSTHYKNGRGYPCFKKGKCYDLSGIHWVYPFQKNIQENTNHYRRNLVQKRKNLIKKLSLKKKHNPSNSTGNNSTEKKTKKIRFGNTGVMFESLFPHVSNIYNSNIVTYTRPNTTVKEFSVNNFNKRHKEKHNAVKKSSVNMKNALSNFQKWFYNITYLDSSGNIQELIDRQILVLRKYIMIITEPDPHKPSKPIKVKKKNILKISKSKKYFKNI